jgi:hypothetical protein
MSSNIVLSAEQFLHRPIDKFLFKRQKTYTIVEHDLTTHSSILFGGRHMFGKVTKMVLMSSYIEVNISRKTFA